jgi:two-component system NarL family sensor kinase
VDGWPCAIGGLGIPEEHRAHLFDRFYQAHADHYRSGLGLGLYISREIVALHGGRWRRSSRGTARRTSEGSALRRPAPGVM